MNAIRVRDLTDSQVDDLVKLMLRVRTKPEPDPAFGGYRVNDSFLYQQQQSFMNQQAGIPNPNPWHGTPR